MTLVIGQGADVIVQPAGIRGAAGPASGLTLQATITKAPGTDAEVLVGGAAPNQTLAFKIPRGSKINFTAGVPGALVATSSLNSDWLISGTGKVYEAVSSAWVERGNFTGPQGARLVLRYVAPPTDQVQWKYEGADDSTYQVLFAVPSMAATSAVRDQILTLQDEIEADNAEAIDAVQASADAAEASRIAAAASAASLNLPTITSGDKLKHLRVNAAGSAFEFADEGQWTQIGSPIVVGSPQSAIVLNGFPSGYRDLRVDYAGLSHNDAGSPGASMSISTNGTTFSSGSISVTGVVSAAETRSGRVIIEGFHDNISAYKAANVADGSSPSTGAGTTGLLLHTGGLAALRIAYSSGQIDAGTFTVFGR